MEEAFSALGTLVFGGAVIFMLMAWFKKTSTEYTGPAFRNPNPGTCKVEGCERTCDAGYSDCTACNDFYAVRGRYPKKT